MPPSTPLGATAATGRTTSTFETDVVVENRRDEADGVVGLDLVLPGGDRLPDWMPGAHVDVLLPGGQARQYSLCGDPADRHRWQIAVLREPDGRGGSRWIADELATGATLRVRGPRNNFPLLPAERYVFIAGGIGITPLLPMIRTVAAGDADWGLHYGGRTRASMAFLDRLAAHGDRVRVRPQDEAGLLDLTGILGTHDPRTLVYCCGPSGLLDAVELQCRDLGPGMLHVERFTAAPASGDADPAGNETFEVVCSGSGITVAVPPELTVLEAVENSGIPVLSSCTEGTCGTCETTVLDGEVDHRDSILSDEERAEDETMMICVSRCRGARLVLDL